MSDELKQRMEHRRKGIKPPYLDFAPNVLFPTLTRTTCDEVIEDVWKAAWEEALRVVDEWWGDAPRERDRDNPNNRAIQQCTTWQHHVPHEYYSPAKKWYWCEGVVVCGCAGCQDPDRPLPDEQLPDVRYHMDDEVEAIHECYQNLMRLDDEKARKRALYYLLERMGISSEF